MSDPDPRAAIENTCFVACTRPANLLGAPAEGVWLNLCGSIIVSAWVGMHSWHMILYMIVLVPSIHMVMRYASARDHNWVRVHKLGIESKGYGTSTWGGSTVTPIPARWPRKAKDLPIGL